MPPAPAPAVLAGAGGRFGGHDLQAGGALSFLSLSDSIFTYATNAAHHDASSSPSVISVLPPRPQIAGPGFINVYLSKQWVAGRIEHMLRGGAGLWVPPPPEGRKRVLVDFSSPNIAKVLAPALPALF